MKYRLPRDDRADIPGDPPGALAEATTPAGMRWLPKRMEVDYLAKATTDLVCIAESTAADWDGVPDVPVCVRAVRADGTVVARGVIHLWVTPGPKD